MEMIYFLKLILKKDQQTTKIMKNFQACKELSLISCMIIIQVALVQIKVSFIVGKTEISNQYINLCHAKPGYILRSQLIRIHTVCHSACTYMLVTGPLQIKSQV